MLNHHTFLAAILLLWSGKGIQAAEPEYWDISSVKEMPCPPDTEWKEWDDDFYSGSTRQTNPYDKWTFARGGKGDVHDGTGMPMALKEGVGNSKLARLMVTICLFTFASWDTRRYGPSFCL